MSEHWIGNISILGIEIKKKDMIIKNDNIQTPDEQTLDTWEQDTEQNLKDATLDYISTAKGLKVNVKRKSLFSSTNFLTVHKQLMVPLENATHSIKENYSLAIKNFIKFRFEFLQLAGLKSDQTLVNTEVEKAQFETSLENKKFLAENEQDYVTGTNAQCRIIQAENELIDSEITYEKQQHLLQAVKQSALGIEVNAKARVDTLSTADNSIGQAQQQVDKLVSPKEANVTLPTYPESTTSTSTTATLDRNIADKANEVFTNAAPAPPIADSSTPAKKKEDEPEISWTTTSGPEVWLFITQCWKMIVDFGRRYSIEHIDTLVQMNVEELQIETTPEEETKEANFKKNTFALFVKSPWKVIALTVIYAAAILGECLLYASILGEVYHLSGVKLLFTSSVAALLSTTVALAILGEIRDWVLSNSRLNWKALFSSRIMTFCVIASGVFCLLMGILYWDANNKSQQTETLITMKTERYRLENQQILADNMDDKKSLEDAILKHGKKIEEKEEVLAVESTPISIIKMCAIGASNLLFMFLSAVMASLLMIATALMRAEKKKEKSKAKAFERYGQFQIQKNCISRLHSLAKQIIELQGRLLAIRLMRSAGSNSTDTIYKGESERKANKLYKQNGHADREVMTTLNNS